MDPDDITAPAAGDVVRGPAVIGEPDRAALAREIHDRIANGIMAGILRLDLADGEEDPNAARELRAAGRDLLAQALHDAQTIATGLRDPERFVSLHARVAEYLARATTGTGIDGTAVSRGEPTTVDDVTQEHVFLLVREAVRNAVAHADASRIDVSLQWGAATLVVEVTDDGKGFELFEVRAGAMGLLGMKERADCIRGRLAIVSDHDRGTSIRFEVPCEG